VSGSGHAADAAHPSDRVRASASDTVSATDASARSMAAEGLPTDAPSRSRRWAATVRSVTGGRVTLATPHGVGHVPRSRATRSSMWLRGVPVAASTAAADTFNTRT